MRFVGWLRQHGHDAVHTLDLPLGNRTPDSEIVACAIRDDRIVVTKDSDFVRTFVLTGNVSNVELEASLHRNMPAIEQAFANFRYVEITRTTLIVHK